MSRNLTLAQKRKYDVNQKIFEELADSISRTILFSTRREAQSGIDLSREYGIPLSTVYKKLTDLEDLSLIYVEKKIFSDNGKPVKLYRSRIKEAKISVKKIEPRFVLTPNKSK